MNHRTCLRSRVLRYWEGIGNVESKEAAEFSKSFVDPYPAEFTRRYEALECLSSASACETLLVRDRTSGRLLVAKCYDNAHPLCEMTEPEALHRLSHPGLPAFVEEIHGGGMRCILREYIAGKTLGELGKSGPFPSEMVRRAGLELCAILQYLHIQVPPIIHRDIKPQNVVLREDGTLALIDLGVSRLYSDGAPSDTLYCGTRNFAAPEQYGFLQTDCRSDIYTLGVLLIWMLTGTTELVRAPATRLERILAKCTAFAPGDRYRKAEAVARALKHAGKDRSGRWLMQAAVWFLIAVTVIAGAGRLVAGSAGISTLRAVLSSEAVFTEPLIEKAVRQTLGKSPNAALSPGELSSVKALYISADIICADEDAFYQASQAWYDAGVQTRGPIASLEDLKLLPGLESVYIGSEHVRNLSPLTALKRLKKLELRFNDVSDVSSLKRLLFLSVIGLNANPVADIKPLADCEELRCLDLCGVTGDYDVRDLSKLGDLDFLDISNQGSAYQYLGKRSIRELKASSLPFTDLSFLRQVGGLEKLEVCHGKLSDLSGLAEHPKLTYLRLCNIPATDYSVLLKLPKLKTVVVSASAKKFIAPVAAKGTFVVEYQ